MQIYLYCTTKSDKNKYFSGKFIRIFIFLLTDRKYGHKIMNEMNKNVLVKINGEYHA